MSRKYGCITPNAKGRTYPVAASQHFNHNFGNFVSLDSSGHVTLALTATTTLFGFVEPPNSVGTGAAGSAYFKSSATAGADKMFVITDLNAEFVCPADDTVTAAMAGNACDLVAVNDGTGQTVDVGTSTTDVLRIVKQATEVGSGYAATDVVVKINPSKVQSDT